MRERGVAVKTRHCAFLLLLVILLIALWTNPLGQAVASSLSESLAHLVLQPPRVLALANPLAPPRLWVSPAAPTVLRERAASWSVPVDDIRESATLQLDIVPVGAAGSEWVYALVAPFPTITDGVTSNEILSSWNGAGTGPFAGRPLLMEASTLAAFTALWGLPAEGAVQTIPADQLLETAWRQRPSWAIVPFEALEPRWKVLAVNGQSPVQKHFELHRPPLLQTSFDYPLLVRFGVKCSEPCLIPRLPVLPATNRDPAKLTTLVTTGVTALVRATAYTMNAKGITYPGKDIRDWLVDADVTHISNEVPFAESCPAPDPLQAKLVFCSDPRYIELLNYLGTDVVELTGNHYADYGADSMLFTLKLYRDNHIAYYGGGADLEDARRPLLLEDHGNRLAFIGCNSVDVGRKPTASTTRPGAAPCDYEYMTSQIRALRVQGYIVMASFQYYESYEPKPFDQQVQDFRLMADAGANIVQGSQAHLPQALEFRGDGLIHYGLGNLFFDQMGVSGDVPTRHEFIDRHIIYDGHFIGTELLTAQLEDFARPRPMTIEERSALLSEYFAASGW
jgi:hypothetical protein